MPSLGRGSATTSPRSSACGQPAIARRPPHGSRSRSGSGTNLVGPPELVRARLVDYERSGVTTLRVGVDGSFDQKIADLETLLALAADAGDETADHHDDLTDDHTRGNHHMTIDEARTADWPHTATRLPSRRGTRRRASSASATAGSRSVSAPTDTPSSGSEATRTIPPRRGTRARRPSGSTTTRTAAASGCSTRLRRRGDGTFEEVDWETAAREVAERLGAVRDEFGGDKIMYYGGGGQGNHLCGAYGAALHKGFGGRYRSSAIGQEKSGEIWVNGVMFGNAVRGEFDECEVAFFIGKNPWMSHGIPHARTTLKAIANDDEPVDRGDRPEGHRDGGDRRLPPPGRTRP